MKLTTKILPDLTNTAGEHLNWYVEPNQLDEDDLWVQFHTDNGSLVFECPISELENICKATRLANKAENDALNLEKSHQ